MVTEIVEHQTLGGIFLGEAHLLAGHLKEAHTLAERALALTRAHQERGNEAYALRLLGDIAAQREPPVIEPAASHYQHALALAGELGMRPLQAHCHRGLGTLYSQTGRAALARVALSTAIEMYRAMDMTLRLKWRWRRRSDGHGMFLLHVVGAADCHKPRAPAQHYGKRAEARELLAPIYDWCPEGVDLQEAKGLMEELA